MFWSTCALKKDHRVNGEFILVKAFGPLSVQIV